MAKFSDLETLTEIPNENSFLMSVLKRVNDQKISYRIPLKTLEQFYINTDLIDQIKYSIDQFRQDLENLDHGAATKEFVEQNFLEKKDANYAKSHLLTEARMNALLSQYCNEKRVDIDVEYCNANARSVATSIANYLAMIAATVKTANAANMYGDDQTSMIADVISELTPPETGG